MISLAAGYRPLDGGVPSGGCLLLAGDAASGAGTAGFRGASQSGGLYDQFSWAGFPEIQQAIQQQDIQQQAGALAGIAVQVRMSPVVKLPEREGTGSRRLAATGTFPGARFRRAARDCASSALLHLGSAADTKDTGYEGIIRLKPDEPGRPPAAERKRIAACGSVRHGAG